MISTTQKEQTSLTQPRSLKEIYYIVELQQQLQLQILAKATSLDPSTWQICLTQAAHTSQLPSCPSKNAAMLRFLKQHAIIEASLVPHVL